MALHELETDMADAKVALITGSGKKRVGWYVADMLAQRGWSIAVHYRSSAAEARETLAHLQGLGASAALFQADLTDETAVRRLVDNVHREFGRLDVLVNTAAIWPSRKLEDTTAADVRTAFDTNLLSVFLCSQHAGLIMCRQEDGGCIITVGDWAIERPYLDHAAYFLSKGAIPTMTRMLAVEFAARNPRVRVNCILPGPVMLPESMSADERNEVAQATLVKHEGRPENFALAVRALVDNDFVTGVCLPVDGGRSIS